MFPIGDPPGIFCAEMEINFGNDCWGLLLYAHGENVMSHMRSWLESLKASF